MRQLVAALAASALVLMVGACAAPGGSGPGEVEIRSGVIEQINPTEVKTNHDMGLGAILGGVAGAGLGSLIGGGTGREVAIAAGAIVGAVGGNYAQKQYFDKPQPAQQVIVRLNSGVLIAITQPINTQLRPGQKVYIEGSGPSTRVVPQY
jgi:outer membrane lipoprotein SlyB